MTNEERPKYIIANSYEFGLLAVQVNTYMDIGYVPVGGVHATQETLDYSSGFYQAMVLRDPIYLYEPGELVMVK